MSKATPAPTTIDELAALPGFDPGDYVGRPGPAGALRLPSAGPERAVALADAKEKTRCCVAACRTPFALGSSVGPRKADRVMVCGYCRAAVRRRRAAATVSAPTPGTSPGAPTEDVR